MDGNAGKFALSSTSNEVSIRQNSHHCDSEAEKPFDWAYPFVDSFLDVDFEDVSGLGATVNIGVLKIKGCAGELTLDIAEVGVESLDLLIDWVYGQNLDAVLLHGNQPSTVIIKENDLVHYFLVGSSVETFSRLHIPNNQHVSELDDVYLSSWQP
jgi:hypothetical protein